MTGSLEGLDQYSPVLTPRGNSVNSSSSGIDPQLVMFLGSGSGSGSGSKLSVSRDGEAVPEVLVNSGGRELKLGKKKMKRK